MPQEAVAAPPSLLIREGLHPLAARRPRAELDTAWMRTDASYFALDPDEPAAIHGTAAASGTRTGVQTIRKKKSPRVTLLSFGNDGSPKQSAIAT